MTRGSVLPDSLVRQDGQPVRQDGTCPLYAILLYFSFFDLVEIVLSLLHTGAKRPQGAKQPGRYLRGWELSRGDQSPRRSLGRSFRPAAWVTGRGRYPH
jgi:hypothetical protein